MVCVICQKEVEKNGIWISCDTLDDRALIHRECYEKLLEKMLA